MRGAARQRGRARRRRRPGPHRRRQRLSADRCRSCGSRPTTPATSSTTAASRRGSCAAVDPDVLCLQEVPRRLFGGWRVARFAAACGLSWPGRHRGSGGTTVLTSRPGARRRVRAPAAAGALARPHPRVRRGAGGAAGRRRADGGVGAPEPQGARAGHATPSGSSRRSPTAARSCSPATSTRTTPGAPGGSSTCPTGCGWSRPTARPTRPRSPRRRLDVVFASPRAARAAAPRGERAGCRVRGGQRPPPHLGRPRAPLTPRRAHARSSSSDHASRLGCVSVALALSTAGPAEGQTRAPLSPLVGSRCFGLAQDEQPEAHERHDHRHHEPAGAVRRTREHDPQQHQRPGHQPDDGTPEVQVLLRGQHDLGRLEVLVLGRAPPRPPRSPPRPPPRLRVRGLGGPPGRRAARRRRAGRG